MNTFTPATTPTATRDHRYLDTLARLHGSASGPDDLSGGLDKLVDAAWLAERHYEALDDLARQVPFAARQVLRREVDAAFDAWQAIEAAGLPLLDDWRRECCGYSESEIVRSH